MGQVLHGSATTTEAIRRAIQHSQASLRQLAKRYGINPKTVAKWKARSSTTDQRTGPREPRSAVLSADEEAVVVAFRRHTLLPLDDCLDALQPTLPHLTRSTLHRGLGEGGAVVRQHDADRVGHCSCKRPEEVAGDAPGCLLMQLDEGELGCAVDGDQEIELALFGSDLGNVDVEEANRVALEPGALGLVAAGVGQARHAVPLEAAMEG